MITNKTVCRIWQSTLFITFLQSEFVDTVLVVIVFVIFVYTILITSITLSHEITKVSAILFISLIHVLGFRLIFFALTIIFTFTLTCFVIPFLIWITCCTIAFSCKFTITWNMFYQCFSLIFICYYIICLNIYIFHFIWSTYSHRLIITRITTSTTFI